MSNSINQTALLAGAGGFLLFPLVKWLFGVGVQTLYSKIQTEDPHTIKSRTATGTPFTPRLSSKPSILVVGSANADIYIKSHEIPKGMHI